MTKRVPITQFMPLEVTEWLHSTNVQAMWAEQRGWYLHLLLHAWNNDRRPCHLPNSEDVLWSYAGAQSKQAFMQNGHRAKVLRMFSVCGDGQWLCNVKSLRLYLDKLSTYYQRKIPVETLLFIFNSCTCLSKEEKERLRGNDGRNIDTEQLTRAIRAIGFRDSQAISVEHAIVDELSIGNGSGAELLAALQRIFHWTENGVYAPRLHEVIRRWKEPQHLWERKRDKAPIMAASISTSNTRLFHARCFVCTKDLGPLKPDEKISDMFVCSDECAAKSGYEVTQ